MQLLPANRRSLIRLGRWLAVVVVVILLVVYGGIPLAEEYSFWMQTEIIRLDVPEGEFLFTDQEYVEVNGEIDLPPISLSDPAYRNAQLHIVVNNRELPPRSLNGDVFEVRIDNLAWGLNSVRLYLTDLGIWGPLRLNDISFDVVREKKIPSPPRIIDVMPVHNEPERLLISGLADPFVQLTVSEHSNFLPGAYADRLGRFYLFLDRTQVSTDQIQLSAVNSRGKRSIVQLELKGAESRVFPTPDPASIQTSVFINVGYRSFQQKYQVQIPRDSPLLSGYLTNQVRLPDLLKTMTGDFQLNNIPPYYVLVRDRPSIKIEDGQAVIVAEGRTVVGQEINSLRENNLSFQFPYGFPLPGTEGSFEVNVQDYDVVSVEPVPDQVEENKLVWLHLEPAQEVRIQLHRGVIASLPSLGISELEDMISTHWFLGPLYNILRGVIRYLPLILLVLLTSRTFPALQEEGARRLAYAKSMILAALQFSLLMVVWGMIYNLRGFIDTWAARFFSGGYTLLGPLYRLLFDLRPYENFFEILVFEIALLVWLALALAEPIFTALRSSRRPAPGLSWLNLLKRIFGAIALFEFLFLMIGHLLEMASIADLDTLDLVYTLIPMLILFRTLRKIVRDLYVLTRQERPGALLSLVLWVFLLALAILLAQNQAVEQVFAFTDSIEPYYFGQFAVFSLFGHYASAASTYAFLAIILIGSILWKQHSWHEPPQEDSILKDLKVLKREHIRKNSFLFLGLILFSGYIVGMGDTIAFLPVSFLVSIWMFQNVLILPAIELAYLAFWESRVFRERSELLPQLAKDLALNKLLKKRDDALFSLANGKILFTDYEKTLQTINAEIEAAKLDASPKEVSALRLALAYGPTQSPYQNALISLRWAFFCAIPLFLLFVRYYLVDQVYSSDIYIGLAILISILVYVTKWAVIGFFFGLFYEYIRGNNGVRKALSLIAAIVLSLLPYRLLNLSSINDLAVFIFEMAQTALFILLLGILLDWETLRKYRFHFNYLRVVASDVPSLLSVSSVLVTTIGAVVTSLLSGQLTQIFTSIITNIAPIIPNLPLPGTR